jgi:hypothetical protein
MHIIKAYEPSVTLFAVDGEVRVFRSKADALRQLGYRWICEHVREDFVVFSYVERKLVARDVWSSHPFYHRAHYVMRDDAGAKVTASDFAELRAARRLPYWLQRWNGVGPVPYVHRPTQGHYYRRPQTLNERKLAQALDGEPAPRAGRATVVPSDWDDRCVASRRERNWKKFRRTQWKTKD